MCKILQRTRPISELMLIQRSKAVKLTCFSPPPPPQKKKSNFTLFCIQFHAYNYFRVFNNSPMPVNMLLLACEIITLKRNLNYTADRAVRKWLSEYIALICECRHRLRCLCFIYCNRVSFEKEEAKTTSEEIRPRCLTVSLSFTSSTRACCCPAEVLLCFNPSVRFSLGVFVLFLIEICFQTTRAMISDTIVSVSCSGPRV